MKKIVEKQANRLALLDRVDRQMMSQPIVEDINIFKAVYRRGKKIPSFILQGRSKE